MEDSRLVRRARVLDLIDRRRAEEIENGADESHIGDVIEYTIMREEVAPLLKEVDSVVAEFVQIEVDELNRIWNL